MEELKEEKVIHKFLAMSDHVKFLQLAAESRCYDEEMKKITIDHPNFGSEWRLEDLKVITSKKFKNTIHQ